MSVRFIWRWFLRLYFVGFKRINNFNLLSLFFRNLFFIIIHPGLVVGLIPYWIVEHKLNENFSYPFQWFQFLGPLLFLIELTIMLNCIFNFAVEGRGTLSPADPTKKLVISGLYRFSGNPMYLGVIIILLGETIFFQSILLLWYMIFIFLVFNLFILLIEEPRLSKDFGKEHQKYRVRVRMWL